MSYVQATQTFHYEAGTVLGGTVLDSDDPVVQEYPIFFEMLPESEPAPRRPGRPVGSRNKPKSDADD